MTIAVRAEGLGKKYVIRHGPSEQFPTLRDEIAARIGGAFRRIVGAGGDGRAGAVEKEIFWALSGVDFEIQQGERIGIIGRNGAGKTTLLKVLSRITEPSTGRVSMNGRIASLLEVGTGFHPELTGRENIFLNGAILGMGRAQIRRVFDEIVAFAEVERFLDTPVKRYSSGMYVRLAFSVAAHLEPEVLIVDEVLAVGDLDFQKKCLGRMKDVGRTGRTVLFVSHNMQAVEALCDRTIVLDSGSVTFDGESREAIAKYQIAEPTEEGFTGNSVKRDPLDGFRISNLRLRNAAGDPSSSFSSEEEIQVDLTFEVHEQFANTEPAIGITIDDETGRRILTAVSAWAQTNILTDSGSNTVVCVLPSLPLVSGKYFVNASVNYKNLAYDYVSHSCVLSLTGKSRYSPDRNIEHGSLDIDYYFRKPEGTDS